MISHGTQVETIVGDEENQVPKPLSGGEQVEVVKRETENERLLRLEQSVQYWWSRYIQAREEHNTMFAMSYLSMSTRAIKHLQDFFGNLFDHVDSEMKEEWNDANL